MACLHSSDWHQQRFSSALFQDISLRNRHYFVENYLVPIQRIYSWGQAYSVMEGPSTDSFQSILFLSLVTYFLCCCLPSSQALQLALLSPHWLIEPQTEEHSDQGEPKRSSRKNKSHQNNVGMGTLVGGVECILIWPAHAAFHDSLWGVRMVKTRVANNRVWTSLCRTLDTVSVSVLLLGLFNFTTLLYI